jgi:hypothetical protein
MRTPRADSTGGGGGEVPQDGIRVKAHNRAKNGKANLFIGIFIVNVPRLYSTRQAGRFLAAGWTHPGGGPFLTFPRR